MAPAICWANGCSAGFWSMNRRNAAEFVSVRRSSAVHEAGTAIVALVPGIAYRVVVAAPTGAATAIPTEAAATTTARSRVTAIS